MRMHTCSQWGWNVQKFVVGDGDNVWVARVQYPLRLAWALSIHKSQGMTLDRVRVKCSRIFECGQAYVALSRARRADGLWLEGWDFDRHVRVHPRVKVFYDVLSTTAQEASQLLAWQSAQPARSLQLPRVAAPAEVIDLVIDDNDNEDGAATSDGPSCVGLKPASPSTATLSSSDPSRVSALARADTSRDMEPEVRARVLQSAFGRSSSAWGSVITTGSAPFRAGSVDSASRAIGTAAALETARRIASLRAAKRHREIDVELQPGQPCSTSSSSSSSSTCITPSLDDSVLDAILHRL